MALPLLLSLLLAGGGAAASSTAKRRAAKEQWEIRRREEEARNNQIQTQNALDARLAAFKMGQAGSVQESLKKLSDQGYDIFQKSLDRNTVEQQQSNIDEDTKSNATYINGLIDKSNATKVPVTGQSDSADTVKSAATKSAARAKSTRSKVAAMANMGASTRDRKFRNASDMAYSSGMLSLLGNKMQGERSVLGQLGAIQPTRADFVPAARLRHNGGIDALNLAGQVGMTVGGYGLGQALGGYLAAGSTPSAAATGAATGNTTLGTGLGMGYGAGSNTVTQGAVMGSQGLGQGVGAGMGGWMQNPYLYNSLNGFGNPGSDRRGYNPY